MNVLIYLGILNRYKELDVVNVVLYLYVARILAYRELDVYTVVIFGILALLRMVSWHIEAQKKRGMWELMKEFDKRNAELGLRLGKLEVDYTETKRAVALLNNKAVLTQFSQGMKPKQMP